MSMNTKQCAHCGVNFTATHSRHKYCQGKECAIERSRLISKKQYDKEKAEQVKEARHLKTVATQHQLEILRKAQEKAQRDRERAMLLAEDIRKAQSDVATAIKRIGIQKPSSQGVRS